MPATIRLAGPDDAAALAAIYRPVVEDTAISFELEAPTAATMASRVAQHGRSHPWLVCTAAGVVVGYAYATPHRDRGAYRWSVDTSVYVASHARRRGVGRGLYAALLAALTEQGFVTAFAGITLPNRGSVALHEAVGFVPLTVYREVGFKAGRWHDVGWWQRRLRTPPDAPAEPRAVPVVTRSATWEQLLERAAMLVDA
jgi:L-amino acid N-acyltransferase YncA